MTTSRVVLRPLRGDSSDENEICTNAHVKDNYLHHVTTEIRGTCIDLGAGAAAAYADIKAVTVPSLAFQRRFAHLRLS